MKEIRGRPKTGRSPTDVLSTDRDEDAMLDVEADPKLVDGHALSRGGATGAEPPRLIRIGGPAQRVRLRRAILHAYE